MFLKKFKEKSIKRAIHKSVSLKSVDFKENQIQSVGIILNLSEYNNPKAFQDFLKGIGVSKNNIKIITFISNHKKENDSNQSSFFTQKDIGWYAKINSIALQRFLSTKFDVLISYYSNNNLYLNTVTALCSSNFKIGISDYDPRLNDLIINIKSKEIEVFKTETIKYLKILNKIS